MNAIRKNFIQPIIDLWSLIVGLKVTGKYFCYKHKTVHFPRKAVEFDKLETYGGPIELTPSPKNPAKSKCIACGMCMLNCPSGCLTVVKTKAPKPTPEQEKEWAEAEARGEKVVKPKAPKEPAKFLYDFSLCSLCGTCIENCPVKTLRFSHDIYLTVNDRKELKIDLLARLKEQAQGKAQAQPAPKPESADTKAEKEA